MIRDKFWEKNGGWNDEELGVLCVNCGLRFGTHQFSGQLYDQCRNKQTKWLSPSEATTEEQEWAIATEKWRKILDA